MSEERDWFRVVAEEECQACGLLAAAVPQRELALALLEEDSQWTALLTERYELDQLRRRPKADVWSALEYGAHVRDVLGLFGDRVGLALARSEPELGWWDHEAAALDDRYNEQDPRVVAAVLAENRARLVMTLPPPRDEAWQRAGTRRNTERFTVEGLVRFALHEVRHHRLDAERGCTGIRAASESTGAG